ncbi:urease accessory protein UreD [Pseudofrankia sp. EUN1h]|nr:urease accessory protein UreD [Pseudofrankia sp. EUN1h]
MRAHAVRAHAVLRVEAGQDGSARVVEARSAVPLVLRHTGTTTPPRAAAEAPAAGSAGAAAAGVTRVQDLAPPALPTVTVHLVGAAAGPLAGDQVRLDITVGAGVRLVLRSVAATLAMPGHGPGPSVLEIHADVAAGGALDLLPEPTVAVRGCRHRMVGRAVVAAGGWLRWREEVLLGRFGEPSGRVETDLRVDIRAPAGDRPLLRQQLPLGPDVLGLTGAALIGSARAVGSLLIAAPAPTAGIGPAGLGVPASVIPPPAPGATRTPGGAAVLPLAGPGVLVTALAADAVTLRRHLGPEG